MKCTTRNARGARPHQAPFLVAVMVPFLFSLGACGGGSTTGQSSNTLPPTITAIQAACIPSTVTATGTAQCSAAVTGTGHFSSQVNWTTSDGTITPAGLFTADGDGDTVIVTATSVQDASITRSVSVTVQPPVQNAVTAIAVICTPPVIAAGGTAQCSAALSGIGNFSSAVTWSADAGTISANGLYSAPASGASVTVTATSQQDPTVSGKAMVSVQAAAVRSSHIVMVMEENQSYDTVAGNTSAWPNLNQLIATGALPTHYYGNTHPSIGNYFMLTTGQVLTNNDSSTMVWSVDNLARRMLAAKVSFRIYAEGISQGYVGGNTGLYLQRHNPFAMLSDLANNPAAAQQHIWPFAQFAVDLANGTLPQFAYIVPDIEDDAHNGTPLQADSWLQENVVQPLANTSAFAAGGDGLLIVNFDEAQESDASNGGGHVAPVFWGPLAKSGYLQTSVTVYQHQSMLRAVMTLLGLGDPPGAAADAPPMTEFFAAQP